MKQSEADSAILDPERQQCSLALLHARGLNGPRKLPAERSLKQVLTRLARSLPVFPSRIVMVAKRRLTDWYRRAHLSRDRICGFHAH